MDPRYDPLSWSTTYREEALREAQVRHLQQGEANVRPMSTRSIVRLVSAAVLAPGRLTAIWRDRPVLSGKKEV